MEQTHIPDEVAQAKIEAMIGGYQKTQALYLMVKLGIAERLGSGLARSEALATAIGVNAGGCYRLLRGLEFMGLVREPSPGTFGLTPLGERVRSDMALQDEIILTGDAFARWWTGLEHSVRTGETSVPGIDGVSAFEVLHRHPDLTHRFNRLMSAMVGAMSSRVVAVYDFSAMRTVVDIGGGRGTLLSAILQAHPHLQGVLFDLPATVSEAKAAFAEAGLADRCATVGGDFFAEVPAGDGLILSAVLSDWNDEKSVAILENCRRAIAHDGRLLILERLLEPERPAPASAFMDLHMLVIGGGTGRSEPEYRRLLEASNFELVRVIPTGSARSIFEARPR